jgi:hypothetical protein
LAGEIYPVHCGLKIIDMRKKIGWMLLPLLAVGCAKPTGFNYLGVKNFKVVKFGLKESTVAVDAEFYNPNKYPVTMKGGTVDVFVK